MLSPRKRHTMFCFVISVLFFVPIKAGIVHKINLLQIGKNININIWLIVCRVC
jgi:hypothetical protein